MSDSPRVRRSPVPPSACNLAKSFELIGDHWTLQILRSALYGVCRFDDFQDELGVPRSVLSSRIAGLVDAGLMERRSYQEPGARARFEYPLTRMGRDLTLPFLAMTEWGDRWLGDGEPPLELKRKATGSKLRVALVDAEGRATPLNDLEIVVAWPRRKTTRSKRARTGTAKP